MKKGILSILLTVCLLVGILPTVVYAYVDYPPEFIGIEDNATYCDTVEFEVYDEKGEGFYVYINRVRVSPNSNQKYTVEKGSGNVSVNIMSPAGDRIYNITVNDGHTDENYNHVCDYCNADVGIHADKDYDCKCDYCKGTMHSLQKVDKKDATCTEDGNKEYWKCQNCGELFSDENGETIISSEDTVITKTGHNLKKVDKKDATCTEDGNIEYWECQNCGELFKDENGETVISGADTVITRTGHSLQKVEKQGATVTETGNTEYWHCKDCDKYFSDENGENEIELTDTVIAKLSPEIIEGKGQSITAGEKKELTFKSNAAFSDFIRVELDGKTLDEKNYTVKEGSTVVTLKADYVATLSAGEHTIGIVSASGTATTTFTVNVKAVVDNDTKSPQTGDNSHMALWIALLFMSGAGVIGTTVYGKKKRAK